MDYKPLLELARKTLEAHFSGEKLDTSKWDNFNKKQGVFVTLHKAGDLRGCIGFPMPVYELKEAIVQAAKAAALNDPRFPRLDEDELSEVKIEISVLTVPKEIKAKDPLDLPSKVKVGEDGLIVKGLVRQGLLLPQVFTEYKCDAESALSMTCQKAGLADDEWKTGRVVVEKFQAKIVSE
ncbi:AmmeMemoRadiSam system protein A [Nanoarchaeota archaeon]